MSTLFVGHQPLYLWIPWSQKVGCVSCSLIKSVSVKAVHKDVHRMALNSLLQDKGDLVLPDGSAVWKQRQSLVNLKLLAPIARKQSRSATPKKRLVAVLCNQEQLSQASTLTDVSDGEEEEDEWNYNWRGELPAYGMECLLFRTSESGSITHYSRPSHYDRSSSHESRCELAPRM